MQSSSRSDPWPQRPPDPSNPVRSGPVGPSGCSALGNTGLQRDGHHSSRHSKTHNLSRRYRSPSSSCWPVQSHCHFRCRPRRLRQGSTRNENRPRPAVQHPRSIRALSIQSFLHRQHPDLHASLCYGNSTGHSQVSCTVRNQRSTPCRGTSRPLVRHSLGLRW